MRFVAGLTMTAVVCAGGWGMAEEEKLPDLYPLLKWRKPADTEKVLRDILPRAREANDPNYLGELLTQIARARGLQKDYEGAHALLDEADDILKADGCEVGRVRSALERGRTLNSSGKPDASRPHFIRAYTGALKAGADLYAVDAVHMLAYILKLETDAEKEEAIAWNDLAIHIAQASKQERARAWLATMYQNQGYTRLQRGEYDLAMGLFENMRAFCEAQENVQRARVAKWFIGQTLRKSGKTEEALKSQLALLAEYEAAGEPEAGYASEEIAECLWALDRKDEAAPHYKTAYEKLSKDTWLVENEPDRIKKLKERGGVAD